MPIAKDRKAIRSGNPSFEPVTLAQAKAQVRIALANTDHDDYLNRLIQMSREQFEADTSVVVATGTFMLSLDGFDGPSIVLPVRPVTSVTSITYKDTSGATQTLSGSKYALSTVKASPEIVLAYNESWPDCRGHQNDVTFTFVAGYATAGAVPETIKQACLLLITQQFEGDTKNEWGYEQIVKRHWRSSYP